MLKLRLSASAGDGWLYDCHAARFAPVEHGACAASGFVPLFLGQLVAGPARRGWPRQLDELGADGQDALLATLKPAKPAAIAAEIAFAMRRLRFAMRC